EIKPTTILHVAAKADVEQGLEAALEPATNEVFQKFGTNPDASVMYSSLNPSANPFTGLFAALSHVGIIGYVMAGILLLS
ncbi:hypothetical protein O5286_29325, partial [Escherichia coli]|nr:hypothetical protein [Escherichia coli]